jgi:hypothetical protein
MKDWYIARGNKKYGPYTEDELIQLRQQGKAFEYDLIWKQGLRQWKPFAQTDEFSAHAMAERVAKSESCAVFNRRQWPRVRKEVAVIVHNDQYLWNARTLNISQGGALIELNSPFLKPGDTIHIHFQSQDEGEQRFSCVGVITGKRHSNERLKFNTSLQYSVRFDAKDAGAEQQLEIWVKTILTEKLNAAQGAKYATANN